MTKQASELQKQIDDLRKLIHGIAAMHGDELVKDAAEKLGMQPVDLWDKAKSLEAVLRLIADEEWEKQRQEYQRIIAENNNNNNSAKH